MFVQVTASAGSGKTYQLTRRFLALLLNASEASFPPACRRQGLRRHAPAEIMAITFTNKAAAEMKERLIAALKSLALGISGDAAPADFSAAEARRHLDELFRHYQRLQIRTIDSLLVMLARLFAADLGLAPNFETVFDEADIVTPLYDRLVSRAEAGFEPEATLLTRAVAAFSGARGFAPAKVFGDRLRDMFRLLLTERGELASDPAPFTLIIEAACRDLAQAATAVAGGLAQASCPAKAQFAAYLTKCRALAPGDKLADSAFAAKPSLAECVLAAGRARLTPDLESAYATFKRRLDDHAEAMALAGGALKLVAFVDLGRALASGLEGGLNERARIAHARIAELVRESLERDSGVPEAFCRLGARLTFLLIDEFQDTSRAQWRALWPLAQECLAKGGGLYLVGDVKQAIYGWRGGDARLFSEAARDPGLCVLSAPTLDRLELNWRSSPRVVAFNNAFFTALAAPAHALQAACELAGQMPGGERDALAARISEVYSDCAQLDPPGRDGAPEGFVSIAHTPGASQDDILAGIKPVLHRTLCADILTRRAPGEVAILTRSNDQAAIIARWLLEWDVPAVTENSLRLAERPLIRELTAFLAFLDYPLNDAAFWEFISSPELFGTVSGLSRESLLDWLCSGEPGALYVRFRRDFEGVWRRLIRPFSSRAGLTGAYDLVGEIVKAYGLYARCPDDEGFVRRFLEVVHAAGEKGFGSLAGFLDFWRRKGAEEAAPRPESLDAVRIMTVHKAKGLEFGAVIVPFHAFGAPKADETAVLSRYGLRFACKLSPHAGAPYYERLSAAALEELNLLYVAWTRAARELHLFLQPGAAGTSPLVRVITSLLPPLGIDPSAGPVELGSREPGVQDRPPAAPAAGKVCAAQPSEPGEDFTPMRWLPRLRVYRNTVESPRAGAELTEAQRGEAAHRAMQLFRPGDTPRENAARAVTLALRELRLPGAVIERLRTELAAMLDWVLTLPDFTDLLDRGERERDLVDEDGNVLRPDLFAAGEGGLVVVDYKTGAVRDEHATQVRRYLRLLAEAGAGRPDTARGRLVYLDRRQVVPVTLKQPSRPGGGHG